MKLLIQILACLFLSSSLYAETYLSSITSGHDYSQTIAQNDILIIKGGNIYVYQDGSLLTYFDASVFYTIDPNAGLNDFKYDQVNRRLVFGSENGIITYNIDNEKINFIETGFPVRFFDVYNNIVLICTTEDFIWWDLDKGEIKRDNLKYSEDIMFRMVDESRFILYYAGSAYLYSGSNYEKLFDNVNQLLGRYSEIQLYKDYLLYKPFKDNTVIFNLTTREPIAELDNSNSLWNLVAFKDNKVFYSNNDFRLEYFDLLTKDSHVFNDVGARFLFGKDGNISYEFQGKIFRFDYQTETSTQVVRRLTDLWATKIDLLQDYFVLLHSDPYLDILSKNGESILTSCIGIANKTSYALGKNNQIYYQDSQHKIFILDANQNSVENIMDLDYEVEQLFYQNSTLYYLYNDKVYKFIGNKQFTLFAEIKDCFEVEHIENSYIYFYQDVSTSDNKDQMVLSKYDMESGNIVNSDNKISTILAYKDSFIKRNDTIYQIEYTKLRYINSQTLETLTSIDWENNIRFVDFCSYQEDILLSSQRKIFGIFGKVNEMLYKSRNVSLGSNLLDIAIDGNRCYMLDDRGIIYYEDLTPTGVFEDREEMPSIDLADYISVYDIQGKKIGEFSSYSVCIDNLQRGKYILEYTISNKKYFKQIIRL